jgi:hypothetical protein
VGHFPINANYRAFGDGRIASDESSFPTVISATWVCWRSTETVYQGLGTLEAAMGGAKSCPERE